MVSSDTGLRWLRKIVWISKILSNLSKGSVPILLKKKNEKYAYLACQVGEFVQEYK
jgi:hypothetical protein